MKITSADEGAFLADVGDAFDDAVDDTLDDARRRAPRVTGKWQRSIERSPTEHRGDRLEAAIGSNLVSAKVHERGGYITPKRGEYLVIPQPDGSVRKVKAVRIRAQPAIEPAGRGFGHRFLARLHDVRPKGARQ